jgi:hypothetical protein
MPTHIKVSIGKPSKHRDHEHHDDDLTPGWAAERTPKIESPAKSLSLNPGKWTSQASARSGPAFAPGTKSS